MTFGNMLHSLARATQIIRQMAAVRTYKVLILAFKEKTRQTVADIFTN